MSKRLFDQAVKTIEEALQLKSFYGGGPAEFSKGEITVYWQPVEEVPGSIAVEITTNTGEFFEDDDGPDPLPLQIIQAFHKDTLWCDSTDVLSWRVDYGFSTYEEDGVSTYFVQIEIADWLS